MHLTHQTPSALLQAFGLVSGITNGVFVLFEKKKKKQARGIPRKTTPNCQSQLKSVSLKKSRQLILVWRRKRCQPTSVLTKKKSTIFREPQRSASFPPLERNISSVGKETFQRWKFIFPPLESKVSSLGKLFFQAWKHFGKLTNGDCCKSQQSQTEYPIGGSDLERWQDRARACPQISE